MGRQFVFFRPFLTHGKNLKIQTLIDKARDAQGSEMGGFKKWINTPEYTETFPGFREYVSKIFGGYYSDL